MFTTTSNPETTGPLHRNLSRGIFHSFTSPEVAFGAFMTLRPKRSKSSARPLHFRKGIPLPGAHYRATSAWTGPRV